MLPKEGHDAESKIVLKVHRAKLTENFEVANAKMDPYCIVSLVHAAGDMYELSRTRVDWNAHKTPIWDHTCRSCAHSPGSGSSFRFQVMEANVLMKDAVCGYAEMLLDHLVADSKSSQLGEIKELPLTLKGKHTGTLYVAALLSNEPRKDNINERHHSTIHQLESYTAVAAELFETPVMRLGVSGGTAPFFKLQLCKAKPGGSREYYVGKDLSRASDEVAFYEEVKALSSEAQAQWFQPLAEFMFEYAGILKTHEHGQTHKVPLELLVLRNLNEGCTKLRLLDIKVGQKTAQAGWQGKSRTAALRQCLVDGITNSAGEGFRLEGFDGRPETLQSMDPLLDIGGKDVVSKGILKKMTRIMFQRMTAADMILHFLDLHADLPMPSGPELKDVLSQAEMAEIVLHEVTVKLARLAIACRKSAVPQKWIGSSVALGFDSGSLPDRSSGEVICMEPGGASRSREELGGRSSVALGFDSGSSSGRSSGEAAIRRATVVSIFDWGRSELNTLEKHDCLSEDAKRDRAEYWRYYLGGVDRLSWEAACAYYQRFCNAGGWDSILFKVFDFDSLTSSDCMCSAMVPVQTTPETTIELTLNTRMLVGDGLSLLDSTIRGSKPRITYSMQWREFPASSRLKGSWLVTVKSAENLPRRDLLKLSSTSDPYVEVVASSKKGFSFMQHTTVKARNLKPQWNEAFEVPVAKTNDIVSTVMADAGLTVDAERQSILFSAETHKTKHMGLLEGFSSLFFKASSPSEEQAGNMKSPGRSSEHGMEIWGVLLDEAHPWSGNGHKRETQRDEAEVPAAQRVTGTLASIDDEPLVDSTRLTEERFDELLNAPYETKPSVVYCGCSSNDCVCM